MAIIATTATGDWSDTATWAGGVVPGDGDQVTIGAHTVTVSDDRIIGHSPTANDGTYAIEFTSASGKLVISGATLVVRGDTRNLGNNTVREQVRIETVGSTPGVWEFDSSQAASPSTTSYRVRLMQANSQFAKWRFVGSPTAWVEVRSNASGGNGFFSRAGFVMGGNWEGDYVRFIRLGSASQAVFDYWLGNDGKNEMILRHFGFEDCGRFNATAHTPHANSDLTLEDGYWKGTLHATYSINLGSGPSTNKGRFVRCDPDKAVQITEGQHWTLDGTFFYGGLEVSGTSLWDSAQDVFLRSTVISSPTQVVGPVRRWVVLKDGTGVNPHGISPRGDTPCDVDDIIFDYEGTSNLGDLVNVGGASAPRSVDVRRAIMCRNTAGGQMGKLVSILGANNRVTAEHNTICSDGSGGNLESGVIAYGENYDGADGDILSNKSNLSIGTAAGGAVLLTRNATSSVQLSDATLHDYNATWQGLAGTDGVGYHAYGASPPDIFSSGSPGAHDVALTDDPCVDSYRKVRTWDAYLGGPGTVANAMAEMRKRNEPSGYNSSYSFSALRRYIIGGFKTKVAALRDAGHDGATIGAAGMATPRHMRPRARVDVQPRRVPRRLTPEPPLILAPRHLSAPSATSGSAYLRQTQRRTYAGGFQVLSGGV